MLRGRGAEVLGLSKQGRGASRLYNDDALPFGSKPLARGLVNNERAVIHDARRPKTFEPQHRSAPQPSGDARLTWSPSDQVAGIPELIPCDKHEGRRGSVSAHVVSEIEKRPIGEQCHPGARRQFRVNERSSRNAVFQEAFEFRPAQAGQAVEAILAVEVPDVLEGGAPSSLPPYLDAQHSPRVENHQRLVNRSAHRMGHAPGDAPDLKVLLVVRQRFAFALQFERMQPASRIEQCEIRPAALDAHRLQLRGGPNVPVFATRGNDSIANPTARIASAGPQRSYAV
jgi:hypothetical protein